MSINKTQLKLLIIETLMELDVFSYVAVNLLMGTCAQESALGTYIKQINGPALGIFQMEPFTYRDIYSRIGTKRRMDMLKMVGVGANLSPKDMVYNMKLAIAMCRYKYLLIPAPLPGNNVAELAAYWKKWYNTPLGRGTEKEFIRNYRKYVA